MCSGTNFMLPGLGMGTGTSSARYSTDGGMWGKYSGANRLVIISLRPSTNVNSDYIL